jgi:hypothetical protein
MCCITLVFSNNDYGFYFALYAYCTVYGYLIIQARQKLMREKYALELSFQQWKYILDIIENPIIIYNSSHILYYNKALVTVIEDNEIRGVDTLVGVS